MENLCIFLLSINHLKLNKVLHIILYYYPIYFLKELMDLIVNSIYECNYTKIQSFNHNFSSLFNLQMSPKEYEIFKLIRSVVLLNNLFHQLNWSKYYLS